MKNFSCLFFLFFFLFTITLSAQINLDVEGDGTIRGTLGIGTNAPDATLEVEGSGNQNIRVQTTSTGSSDAGLELIRGNEFSATDWKIVNSGGQLMFFDGTDNFETSGDLNMLIGQSGFVGLGTDDPVSRLHVSGSDDQFITVHKTTTGSGMAGIDLLRSTEFSATDWRIANDGGVLRFFDGIDNFATTGDENMAITQGGNVGIGTGSPATKLQILGGTDLNLAGGGYAMIGSQTSINTVFDNNEILTRNNGVGSTMYMQYDGGDLLLCGLENGQVGIGITSSSFLPDPSYLLAVDGKILSEEVRVELSGDWPDYVFEKDYPLPAISELELFINEEGHLPGIPSAEKVKKDGILLGEMQKNMMEKIEELTLYIIQLNKENQELKSRVERVEKVLRRETASLSD